MESVGCVWGVATRGGGGGGGEATETAINNGRSTEVGCVRAVVCDAAAAPRGTGRGGGGGGGEVEAERANSMPSSSFLSTLSVPAASSCSLVVRTV